MTPDEWRKTCDHVAEKMRGHTRPFATPLSTSNEEQVRLVGTGSYVSIDGSLYLITCEHVAREEPMEFRFFGSEDVFRCPKTFTMSPHPIDAAFAPVSEVLWGKVQHEADAVPYDRFANKHSPACREELLFFRGYAGENAHYGFGVHQTNGSGYCSQEKAVSEADPDIFEIFWEPENTQYSGGTTVETRNAVKLDDPRGYSGSLVWNTRYLEVTGAGGTWSPDDAVVTGLLRRFDPNTHTLLVWRVEHLNTWLKDHR